MARLTVLSLCVLALVVESQGVYGFSRRLFNRAAAPAATGICATLVTPHGYKCEEHHVQTKDGYILNMQRISEGRVHAKVENKKQPVLIQHGVLVDGTVWLTNTPEENLPMILADQGYDVWIANTRGTTYSKKHIKLSPNQPAFWNWSWDELVSYELPALFGYVFNQTGQEIHYIGHSLGTLIGLASFSEGHQAGQVKSGIFLSPIAYLSHMSTPVGLIGAKAFVGEISTMFGMAEFNPTGEAGEIFLKALCSYPGVDCYNLITSFTGKNCCLNSSTVHAFLRDEPQSTATKNMVHLAQTVRDGVVAKFDYGTPDANVIQYGDVNPPLYNLSNIPHDLPLFLTYGGMDALSDVQDVQTLLDKLKLHDVDKIHVQYIQNYAHADFVMAANANHIVYNQVLHFFKLHQ